MSCMVLYPRYLILGSTFSTNSLYVPTPSFSCAIPGWTSYIMGASLAFFKENLPSLHLKPFSGCQTCPEKSCVSGSCTVRLIYAGNLSWCPLAEWIWTFTSSSCFNWPAGINASQIPLSILFNGFADLFQLLKSPIRDNSYAWGAHSRYQNPSLPGS